MPKPVELAQWTVKVTDPAAALVLATVEVPVVASYFQHHDGFITFKDTRDAVYSVRAELVSEIVREHDAVVPIPARDADIVVRALEQFESRDSDTARAVKNLLSALGGSELGDLVEKKPARTSSNEQPAYDIRRR